MKKYSLTKIRTHTRSAVALKPNYVAKILILIKAQIDLDNSKSTVEVLVGAPHRYRFELKGAVLAYLYKDSKIQLYKDFNLTSDMFIDEKTGTPLGQFRVDSF